MGEALRPERGPGKDPYEGEWHVTMLERQVRGVVDSFEDCVERTERCKDEYGKPIGRTVAELR